jgi:hypothetical protein
LEQRDLATNVYEKESKTDPEQAKIKLVKTLSRTLIENNQTKDPLIQKIANEPIAIPTPIILPQSKETLTTVCLGQPTLLVELDNLINSIEDQSDKELLTEIKNDYIKLVSNKIQNIKERYISSKK